MKKALSLLFVLLLVSCAHKPTANPTGLTQDDFWLDQATRAQKIKEVSEIGKISLRSERESATGRGAFLSKIGDFSRMEIRDPFGRLHFVAGNTGAEFVALYPRKKQAYKNSDQGTHYLESKLGLSINFSQLGKLVVGSLPADWFTGRFSSWEWDEAKGSYVGTWTSPKVTGRAWVDGTSRQVVGLELKKGSETVTINYSDFVFVQATRIAHTIEVFAAKKKTQLSLSWSSVDLKLAPTVTGQAPQIPEGFKVETF